MTKALFLSSFVDVQGFGWCKEEPVRVGIPSATSKILCKRHNELLSDTDSVAAETFDILREMSRLSNVREKMPRRRWRIIRKKINGGVLERWFFRTAINLVCVQNQDVRWSTSGDRLAPPTEIVSAAFGRAQVPRHMGLYFAVNAGQLIESRDHVQFSPLLHHEQVVGGLFEFRGFRFVLNLSKSELPRKPKLLARVRAPWPDTELMFHMRRIKAENQGFTSQILTFTW